MLLVTAQAGQPRAPFPEKKSGKRRNWILDSIFEV